MSIKETMKTILDGGIAYTKKVVKSGVNFVKEHPTECTYILLGGIIVGFTATAIYNAKNKNKYPIPDPTYDAAKALEDEKKTWDEFYKETWDAVNEFAKTLKLQPGEMYIIEDQMQFKSDPEYYTDVDFSMPVISHLVFNNVIYPPGE